MKSLFIVLGAMVLLTGCYQAPREPVYVPTPAPAPAPMERQIIVQPPVIVNPPSHCPPGRPYCEPPRHHHHHRSPGLNINIVPGGGHHHHH